MSLGPRVVPDETDLEVKQRIEKSEKMLKDFPVPKRK